MNLVEFFSTLLKLKTGEEEYIFAPITNEKIGENIYALRDGEVNAFLYKKENVIIAIDCGYKNSENISKAMEHFNISENDVSHLFITHLDIDHAGGIDKTCRRLFKNAKVYIGKIEKKLHRKKNWFSRLKLPIELPDGCTILEDRQTEFLGKIKIQAIHIPGHTAGHLCYLIDDTYLFTGDSIILIQGKGYCFYNQWNVDSNLNMKSLEKLKMLEGIKLVITSHSGYTEDIHNAFLTTNELPNLKEKNYKVSNSTP
jgi:glyoxylase-like metal-dependent hydrolase (beta-lactamase superfamily II)